MNEYEFTITLFAKGDTPEEAWEYIVTHIEEQDFLKRKNLDDRSTTTNEGIFRRSIQ